ncbi:MAG TPA: ParB/RepB/Spo0J family partition protein [Thermoanaerobaculia bacterium]|nr:ParB/RepB/Spo0J family partition protein [Thermoanaerobaculia bacterium]
MTTKKRGLGRGLDALLPETAAAPAQTVPLDRLRPNPRQPRSHFREEDLAELADSIRAQGLVQPILVSPDGGDGYWIIAGERRFRASKLAGLSEVPVVIRPAVTDREQLELALVENLQRADLNALEEAEAYRMLRDDFSLSQEEIGRAVGKSRAAVANALRLLNLPEGVQALLRSGTLTAGQARPLLGIERPDEQLAAAERAVREGLSARDLERLAAQPPARRGTTKPERRVDVHTRAAEEKLTQRLQTRVEIQRRRRGGELRIHFGSEEELMRLYDHFMTKEDAE